MGKINLLNCQYPFLVGIKGVGMTALALIAKQLGKAVNGSDVGEAYLTDIVLRENGINWQTGFEPDALPTRIDYLVATAAHGGLTNAQVLAAQKRQVPTVSYGQALGDLVEEAELIAVTGVGGKTTTAAMTATVLTDAGLDPSFVIGAAKTPPRTVSGYLGQGDFFVVEADDYVACPYTDRQPKFTYLNPRVAVMTNLEYDHPDVYPNLAAMIKAYQSLTEKIPATGLLVVNGDSAHLNWVKKIKSRCQVVTYGFNSKADRVIERFKVDQGKTHFNITEWGEVSLRVPGKLNAMNAAAAVIVGEYLGLPTEKIRQSLASFQGLKRRFELIGKVSQVPVYDDYAHQPNEIRATLLAVKEWFPQRRLRVAFQPHTYTRTKALLNEFARSLVLADEAVILEIFPSQRETVDREVNSRQLAELIASPQVRYEPDLRSAEKYFRETLNRHDLILTMGAGDVYQLAEALVKKPDDC